jgi:hypothetical protein
MLKKELDIVVVDDEQLITDILTGFISLEAPQAVLSLVIGCYYGARNRRPGLAAGTSTPHRLSNP